MLLYDFGKLLRAIVVHRPSVIIRSPYVADVQLLDSPMNMNKEETTHLAHCPALGCCGLSDVGAIVLVRVLDSKHTKCAYQVCVACIPSPAYPIYVGLHPKSAEAIAKQALLSNKIQNVQIKFLEAEKTFLHSRFDFSGLTEANEPFVCEVKTVPLADFVDATAKVRRAMDVEHLPPEKKIAYFPDGYRKRKSAPVSPRATKHIQELTKLKRKHTHWRCIMLFVVQREDVCAFQPSVLDPIYRKEVQKAHLAGVEILCLQVRWAEGRAYFYRNDLPINIHTVATGPPFLS